MRKTLLLTILSCTAIFFSSTATILAIDHELPQSGIAVPTQNKTATLSQLDNISDAEKELISTFLKELNEITPLDPKTQSDYFDSLSIENNLSLAGICDANLKQLWPHLLKLSWLETLDFADNILTSIPDNVNQFSYLKVLNLGNNSLASVPNSLSQCQSLEVLNLSGNKLRSFTFISEKNVALNHINLANNELGKVEIKTLSPTFTTLELQKNKITSLFLEAISLQKLNISNNHDKIIQPALFETLQNLTHLNMSQLYVERIPNEIGLLVKLEELDISLNMLTNLPKSIINLVELKKLEAQRNNIQEIPRDLGQAVHLNYLDLSLNKIKELPDEIVSLQNLQTLNLEGNEFVEVPQVISALSNITSLNFAKNNITEISNLSCLQFLRRININNTLITSLPTFFTRSKITVLYADTPLHREIDSDDEFHDENSVYDEEEFDIPFNSDEEDIIFFEEQND